MGSFQLKLERQCHCGWKQECLPHPCRPGFQLRVLTAWAQPRLFRIITRECCWEPRLPIYSQDSHSSPWGCNGTSGETEEQTTNMHRTLAKGFWSDCDREACGASSGYGKLPGPAATDNGYSCLQLSTWRDDPCPSQPPAKQSHAVKGKVLKRTLSALPYLFIFTFLAEKGADRLKRDLNSHPGGLQESLCKAGQITATFLFSLLILSHRTGIRCQFLPAARQKKGHRCLLRGWRLCVSGRDWTETYWRLAGLTPQEVTTCQTLWPPWDATEHRVAPSAMTAFWYSTALPSLPPPTPTQVSAVDWEGSLAYPPIWRGTLESKLSKKV